MRVILFGLDGGHRGPLDQLLHRLTADVSVQASVVSCREDPPDLQ